MLCAHTVSSGLCKVPRTALGGLTWLRRFWQRASVAASSGSGPLYSVGMRQAPLLALILVIACGGESENRTPSGAAGRGATASGGLMNGSSGAGGSSTGGSGAAGTDSPAGSSYVPKDPNVPAAGDGRLGGGSFEGNLGNGWDFCFTKHPGASLDDATGSSDGTTWLTLDSRRSCADSVACQADGDDVQVGFWLDTTLPRDVPVHLYFDVINLGSASPSGILQLDAMQTCMSTAALATIPLPALQLTSNWTTRCVTFTPSTAIDEFGLFVSGDAFRLGLDTFRFGPECGN